MTQRNRLIVLIATGVVALAATIAVFLPGISGAWPWDDNREITVEGDIQCKGFDSGSDVPFYPYARVEGFEIRGRSNVAQISLGGWAAHYKTQVPAGWKIEWSLKCTNDSDWVHGSFDVNESNFGSSYQLTRHVCTKDGSLIETCGSRDLGKCFELLITRGFTARLTLNQQFKILFNKFGDSLGSSPSECAQAIRDSTPNLSQPTVPTAQPTIPQLPSGTNVPLDPIDTIAPGPGTFGPSAPNNPPQAPRTYTEQSGSHGSPTFQNYSNASGQGPTVPAMSSVEISCKVHPSSTIASASPDGYWYRIASAPWNNQYYAVANTFWNGDTPGVQPYTHNTDLDVPDC